MKSLETTFIYLLRCPETNTIRYIGKANNPNKRYTEHMRKDRTASTHKINWIQSLLNKGLKPVLEILKEVPMNEWKMWEKYYIELYRKKFDLTNYTEGGEGSFRGNQTSFKKGSVPHNAGTRKKKMCAICGELFEVSPSGYKKYKCCSMECSKVYKSKFPNKGTFKKGRVSNNITPVLQINKNTGETIVKYNSITEAQEKLNISHISCVINGNRKTAGGFKWEKV